MLEGRFLQPDPKEFAAGEWSELGSRDTEKKKRKKRKRKKRGQERVRANY
jgi:hypothetical protein